MSEVRFDTRETFALELLSMLDMSAAMIVTQDGHEIVVMFNLPNDVVADRVYAAEATLISKGWSQVPSRYC